MRHLSIQSAQVITSFKNDLISDLKTLVRHGTAGLQTSRETLQRWFNVSLHYALTEPITRDRGNPGKSGRESLGKLPPDLTRSDVTFELPTATHGGQRPGDLSGYSNSQVKINMINQFTIIPLDDLQQFYAIHDAEGKTVGTGSKETCELLVHILSKNSRIRESISLKPSLDRNDNIRAAILM